MAPTVRSHHVGSNDRIGATEEKLTEYPISEINISTRNPNLLSFPILYWKVLRGVQVSLSLPISNLFSLFHDHHKFIQGFVGKTLFPPMEMNPKQSMLPGEIVNEILTMLPVKTLIRFKGVCKLWYSLISSHEFKEEHHGRTSNPRLLLTIRHPNKGHGDLDPDPFTLQFSTYDTMEGALVKTFIKNSTYAFGCNESNCIQSCRGLVCLASTLLDSIIICNPSTEEQKHLPLSKGSARCIGFGYAATIKKFKVVRLFSHNERFGCVVFTVGSIQWREVNADPYHIDHHRWGLGRAPFLNGALHFLPLLPDSNYENDCISVFDVEAEVFSKMSLPDHHLKEFSRRHLCELQGSLCLTVTFEFEDLGQSPPPVEIWILKNYDNVEWVKEYEISAFSKNDGLIDPLGIIGDEIILVNVRRTEGTELIRYCPLSRTTSDKMNQDCSATIFVESLFTPGGA